MKVTSLESLPIEKAKIVIDYLLYLNLFKIVDNCALEIGMLLEVEKTKNEKELTYKLKSFIIPKQTMTSVTCTIQAESELDMLMKAEENGMDIDHIRCWLHSHVNMSVFASGTDEETFKQLAKDVNDYYIMIVVNKKKEFFVKIYDKQEKVVIEDVPVYISYPNEVISDEQAKELIKEAEVVEPKTINFPCSTSRYRDYTAEYFDSKKRLSSAQKERDDLINDIFLMEMDLVGSSSKGKYINKTIKELKKIYEKLEEAISGESEKVKEITDNTEDWFYAGS